MKKTLISTAIVTFLAVPAFAGSHGGGVPGAKFMSEWDLNGDGKVTVEEVAERRSDIFASFDNDDNGVLDAAEYDMFDEARASAHEDEGGEGGGQGGGHNGMGKAREGFKRGFNDTNGDGSVTLEEFVSQAGAWLAMIDRNGDGVITVKDFGPKG